MSTGEFNTGVRVRLAFHPGRSRNTPSRFMLQKLDLSAGWMGHLAHKQAFTFLEKLCCWVHWEVYIARQFGFISSVDNVDWPP